MGHEDSPRGTRPCWHPDLGLPSLRAVREEGPLFKPPRLEDFVATA